MAKRATTRRTAKKTTKRNVRRAPKRAPAAAPKMRLGTAEKPRTKSEVMGLLADHAGISKKEVASVFDGLGQIIKKDLSRSGPGAVSLGGLMKVMVQRKPATRARKGVNPFTGEACVFKAKPARNVVKIRPMKAVKDLV